VIAGLVVAVAWALTPSSPASVPVQPSQTAVARVFVKTDDGGEKSELAARQQSVVDLTDALGAKKKTFTVVESESAADVVVDVLDRGLYVPKVVMGIGPRPGDPSTIPGMVTPVRSPVLRIRVTHGTVATTFTNKNKPPESTRGWQEAAADLTGQIEKWLKAK